MDKKNLVRGKLIIFMLAFVLCVGFWFWAITSGDKLPLTLASAYTVVTLWTFDRWFTIRRKNL